MTASERRDCRKVVRQKRWAAAQLAAHLVDVVQRLHSGLAVMIPDRERSLVHTAAW
jgi:hypothetical protein